MISETTLIKGGRLIVETCMHVEEGEKVVILYDEEHERHAYPGGQNDCRLHLDGSVRNCTFMVDDTVVVE